MGNLNGPPRRKYRPVLPKNNLISLSVKLQKSPTANTEQRANKYLSSGTKANRQTSPAQARVTSNENLFSFKRENESTGANFAELVGQRQQTTQSS